MRGADEAAGKNKFSFLLRARFRMVAGPSLSSEANRGGDDCREKHGARLGGVVLFLTGGGLVALLRRDEI